MTKQYQYSFTNLSPRVPAQFPYFNWKEGWKFRKKSKGNKEACKEKEPHYSHSIKQSGKGCNSIIFTAFKYGHIAAFF